MVRFTVNHPLWRWTERATATPEEMMPRIVIGTTVTAALFAGVSSIACAQSSSTTGLAGNNTSAGPGRPAADGAPAASTSPVDSGAQRRNDHPTRNGSPAPCRPGPPYTSLPCIPLKR